MVQSTEAIVLNAFRYGETSLVVHYYTQHFGRLSVMAHSVRKAKPKFTMGHFQPLTITHIHFYYKQTRDIQILSESNIVHPMHGIAFDVRKGTISQFIAELLNKTIKEVEVNQQFYHFLQASVQLLDLLNQGVENFHLVFMIQLTKYLGIYPGLSQELGSPFTLNTGLQQQLLHISLNECAQLTLSRLQRQQIIESLMDYYYHHVDGLKVLNSYPVLKEIFDYNA
jgi:DNA repair protein RecO (recombination protein O)